MERFGGFITATKEPKTRSTRRTEGTSRQTTLAKVRNQTGIDLERFSIVALGTPIITPAANLVEFKRQISFQGIVPSATTGPRFGVLLEPLKNNFIGTAAVGGCVLTRISVGSFATHAQRQWRTKRLSPQRSARSSIGSMDRIDRCNALGSDSL